MSARKCFFLLVCIVWKVLFVLCMCVACGLCYVSPFLYCLPCVCHLIAPISQVKPLFAELSTEYPSVTFVDVDADTSPVLLGDNQVASFPTFKFYADTQEVDLPVVGGDMEAVRKRIDDLLEEY